MEFDEEFLNGVMSNAETTPEDKVKLILSQHDANVAGLKAKRDELIGKEKNYKLTIDELTKGKTDFEGKIATLQEELKKNNPEDLKKLLEHQYSEKENNYKKLLEEVTADRDRLKESHTKRLLKEAIEEGVKDLQFVDGLKEGFIARVLQITPFEPKEIDGVISFYTKDMKQPKDIMHEFALTPEGKAYIKNPTSGGGANSGTQTINPSAKSMTRAQFEKLEATAKMEFFKNGGTLV